MREIQCLQWVTQQYGRKSKRGGSVLFTLLVPLWGLWSPSVSADHYLCLLYWGNKSGNMGFLHYAAFAADFLASPNKKGCTVQGKLIPAWSHPFHSSLWSCSPSVCLPWSFNHPRWLLFHLQTCSICPIFILMSHLFFFLYYQTVTFASRSAPSSLLKQFSCRSPVPFLSIGLWSVLTLFDFSSIWHC